MADRHRHRPRSHRAALTALVLVLATAAGGCGLSDPYLTPTDTTPNAHGRIAPAPIRPDEAGASTPAEALRRYATIYTNWTARTLPATLHYLASISTGSARRSALALSREETRRKMLLRSHVRNRGSVIAIARGQGPDRGRWVVATREWTSATGADSDLPHGTAHVALAAVERSSGGGWIVSAWRPQE